MDPCSGRFEAFYIKIVIIRAEGTLDVDIYDKLLIYFLEHWG